MDFILKRFLVFSLIALIGFSCSSKTNKRTENTDYDSTQAEQTSENKESEKYAEATISINGKNQIFRFKEINENKVLKIKKIIESSQKLEYSIKIFNDITGEGSFDTVEIRIDKIGKNDFIVRNSIYTHGKYAWKDSLEINVEELFYVEDWREDSTYYKLLPYSNFLKSKDFVDFTYDGFNFIDVKKNYGESVIQGNLHNYFQKKGLLNKFTPPSGLFIDLFKDYKGGLIQNLSLSNPDAFIWFEPTQEFFLFYGP